MFLAYRKSQSFNHNHLHPWPMLEMVERNGAKSTDLEAPESAENAKPRLLLASLCEKAATEDK